MKIKNKEGRVIVEIDNRGNIIYPYTGEKLCSLNKLGFTFTGKRIIKNKEKRNMENNKLKKALIKTMGRPFINKPVQAIKHLTYSRRDMYGNVYGFMTVTNTKTGETIKALVECIGNEDHILNEMGINYVSSETMLPIREYNRLAKGLPYDYVPMLFKLFGKSYKTYLTKRDRQDKARIEAQKKMGRIMARREKREAKRLAMEEKALIKDVPMVQA